MTVLYIFFNRIPYFDIEIRVVDSMIEVRFFFPKHCEIVPPIVGTCQSTEKGKERNKEKTVSNRDRKKKGVGR